LGRAVKEWCSSSSSSSSSDDCGSEGGGGLAECLEAFRQQRAERIAPVVAFTTESGRASYTAAMMTGQDAVSVLPPLCNDYSVPQSLVHVLG
jgi:hypothetical protein